MGDSISKFINAVPFFKEFNEHEKNKMISRSNCFVKFAKNELIFSQGDTGDSLFIVLHGTINLYRFGSVNSVEDSRVSLQKDVEKLVKKIETGGVFGEIAMLTSKNRNVTARVFSTQAVLMKINKALMEGLNPAAQIKFHRQLLLSLAGHLDKMNSLFVDMQFKYETLLANQSKEN
jgi:CRP/FNR family transcriptional regulator